MSATAAAALSAAVVSLDEAQAERAEVLDQAAAEGGEQAREWAAEEYDQGRTDHDADSDVSGG